MNEPVVDAIGAWDVALDEFEATIARCAATLDADNQTAVPPFEPPAVDGPLPGELAARAHHLLARAAELTERMEAEQRRIREELAKLPRRRPEREAPQAEFEAHI
jgi:hypothetical protein